MAEMTMLPFDVLNLILILVATSPDGAATLARVRATCKLLKDNVVHSSVLRVVDFRWLTSIDNISRHHNPCHLICMCAKAGNEVAQSILGKAVLNKDVWIWRMILGNGPRVVVVDDNNARNCRPLRHQRLVRSFIRHGSSDDIAQMHERLHHYLISFAGFEAYHKHGMYGAISNMCSYEFRRVKLIRANIFRSRNRHMARLTFVIPPHGVGPREDVLVIFDKLFP